MSRRNTIILALLFMILVVEILIIAPKELGPGPKTETAPLTKPDTSSPGQVMSGVYSVEGRGDGKQWELWADRATRANDKQDLSIEAVKVMFYGSDGVTYTVTGKRGKVTPNDEGIRDIKISGDVVTRSSNGHTFRTESMTYDSQDRRLVSPTAVEMTSPPDKNGGELKLTGKDMTADLATNEIKIQRGVRARRTVKDNRLAKISSDRALFSGRSNMAHFVGNVVIDFDTMRISGPEAKFAYDRESQMVQSVYVGGGIKVTDDKKLATSDSVNLDFDADKMVLRGAPRVVQGGDELTGDEITFLNGGRKVEVSNARAQLDPNTVEQSTNAAGRSNDSSSIRGNRN